MDILVELAPGLHGPTERQRQRFAEFRILQDFLDQAKNLTLTRAKKPSQNALRLVFTICHNQPSLRHSPDEASSPTVFPTAGSSCGYLSLRDEPTDIIIPDYARITYRDHDRNRGVHVDHVCLPLPCVCAHQWQVRQGVDAGRPVLRGVCPGCTLPANRSESRLIGGFTLRAPESFGHGKGNREALPVR